MKLIKNLEILELWIVEVLEKIRWPAAVILLLMAFLTTIVVIGRYVFLKPIFANSEVQTLMMVIIIFLSLGYCTVKARHANADILVNHLSKRTQAIFGSITWFLSALIFFPYFLANFKMGIWRD